MPRIGIVVNLGKIDRLMTTDPRHATQGRYFTAIFIARFRGTTESQNRLICDRKDVFCGDSAAGKSYSADIPRSESHITITQSNSSISR